MSAFTLQLDEDEDDDIEDEDDENEDNDEDEDEDGDEEEPETWQVFAARANCLEIVYLRLTSVQKSA
jgi:hypothetical protein